MSKVLIISYLFPPFKGPGVQHPTWFFRFLKDYGFETVALTSSVFWGDPVGADLPSEPEVFRLPKGLRARRFCNHLYHAELWTQYRFNTWDPGYVWSVLYGVPAATRLLKRERFAAVISSSPTIASHWTALRIKRRFPGVKWIADFQDPYLGNPFRPESAWTRIDRALEPAIFSTADVLSANTDTVQAMWQKRYPHYGDKMVVTWGGYDSEEAVSAAPLPPDGTPVLKYVGALYGGRTATVLLKSLERLIAQDRLRPGDLVTEFMGAFEFGAEEPLVTDLVRRGFIRLLPNYVPRAQAVEAAARTHYSLLLDITAHNTVLQVPAKLFDQVRIGRPILAFTPSGSPTERILKDSGIRHVSLSPEAPAEEVDSGILRLLQMPALSEPSSEWFRETFDARRLAGLMAARIRGDRT